MLPLRPAVRLDRGAAEVSGWKTVSVPFVGHVVSLGSDSRAHFELSRGALTAHFYRGEDHCEVRIPIDTNDLAAILSPLVLPPRPWLDNEPAAATSPYREPAPPGFHDVRVDLRHAFDHVLWRMRLAQYADDLETARREAWERGVE